MAQYQTGISINETVYRQAKQFAQSQRPPWNFSALVEIALEDYLAAQEKPLTRENDLLETSSNIELMQVV